MEIARLGCVQGRRNLISVASPLSKLGNFLETTGELVVVACHALVALPHIRMGSSLSGYTKLSCPLPVAFGFLDWIVHGAPIAVPTRRSCANGTPRQLADQWTVPEPVDKAMLTGCSLLLASRLRLHPGV